MNGLAALAFWVTIYLPAADFYTNQEHFENIVHAYTQLIVAGLAGFIVGQTINAWTVVRDQGAHQGEAPVGAAGRLDLRGQLGDTLVVLQHRRRSHRDHQLRRLRHLHRAGLAVQDGRSKW